MSGGKEGKVFSRGPSRKALAFLLAICLAAGLSGPYLGSQPFSLAEGQDTTSESAIGAEEPVGGEALSGAGVGIGTDGESAPPQPGEPVPIETPEGGFSPLDTQPEAVSPLEISLADAEGYLTEQIVPSIVIFVHEDATAMDSGLAVGASLQYTASQLGEPIHDVTYVIRSTGGLLLLPPAGYPNAGYDPNSVGFEEVSDTELRITIRKIDNEETGIVAGFPFRVMFPNGTTSDGAIGAAAISEVIYGGSTIIGSVDGDTWDYGDSHRSYRAEMKARAGVSWKYGLSRSPAAGDITLTYGALTGEGNDVATGASLTGDKNFKFTLSLTDNNAGSTQGVMNAERIVAAVTLAGISGAALDTDSFVFSKSPAAIVKDDGTGILTAYWNLTPDEAKNFSCDIAVDKFRLPAGFDSASKAAIVCGTVVFGEKIGGSLALSAVTAIDGEDYPIAVAPPQTFLIKKNAAPAPNYDRPTDDGILTVFRKSFVPWTYDSGLVRSYMTNDPDYPLEKGNQLDFSLIWKNNTERKLTSLEISETSGSGFNASHLKIVGFDKGSVTSGALTTSGPSVTVKYSDDTIVYDAASIDTSKTASEIVFRYTNVAPGYEPATRPSIRFEALPGADSVLSKATLRGTLRNTAYIKYGFDHDSDGATEDKAITGSDWEDVTYLGPAKGQVARNKTAKNLTKNGGYRTGYAAGDNVSYTLNIVNQNLAEVPPFENLLIKDVMDDLLGEVSKVKVVVTSRNTSRMSTISPGGIAGVQSTAPGGGYAITYSEVDVLQFSEMTDEQFDAYVTTEAIATPNGFVLLLKGLFYPGDSIDVIYETALASGAEPTDQPRAVENRYYTAFGYDDEDFEEGDPDGPDDWEGGGGDVNIGENYAQGDNTIHVYAKAVIADVQKYVISGDGSKGTGAMIGGVYVAQPGGLVQYSLRALLPKSQMDGEHPIVAEFMPPGFTLESIDKVSAGSISFDSEGKRVLGALSDSPVYTTSGATVVTGEGTHNVLYFDFGSNKLEKDRYIEIWLTLRAPKEIDFGAATSKAFKNRALFEPNAGSSTAGKWVPATASEGKTGATVETGSFAGFIPVAQKFWDDSSTANRTMLFGTADVTIYRTAAVVGMDKSVTNDAGTLTIAENQRQYKAGDFVYYKSVFTNTAERADNSVGIGMIADWLPPGQTLSEITGLSAKGSTVPDSGYTIDDDITTGAGYGLTRNGFSISFKSPVSLAPGETIALSYKAVLNSDDNLIRKVVESGSPIRNDVAFYVSSLAMAGATTSSATGIYNLLGLSAGSAKGFAGGDWNLGGGGGSVILTDSASMAYTPYEIVPGITKVDANNNASYQAGSYDLPVTWRITVKNGTGNPAKAMGGYVVYDVLPSGVTASAAAIQAAIRDKGTGYESVQVSQPAGTNVLVIAGLPSIGAGGSIDFELESYVLQGRIGSVANRAYLVPNPSDYFVTTSAGLMYDKDSFPAALKDSGLLGQREKPIVGSGATVQITNEIGAEAIMRITAADSGGQTATAESSEPPVDAVRGGYVTYGYILANSGNYSYKSVVFVDVLPGEGDSFVLPGVDRGSKWAPLMTSAPEFKAMLGETPLASEKFTVYYSTKTAINSSTDWSTSAETGWTPAEDWPEGELGDVNALKVVFHLDNGLLRNESLNFSWRMLVPDGAPIGEEAWNSAAFGVTANVGGLQRFAAEPDRVGARVEDRANGEIQIVKTLYVLEARADSFLNRDFWFRVTGAGMHSVVGRLHYAGPNGAGDDFEPAGSAGGYRIFTATLSGATGLTGLTYGAYTVMETDASGKIFYTNSDYSLDGGSTKNPLVGTVDNDAIESFSFANRVRALPPTDDGGGGDPPPPTEPPPVEPPDGPPVVPTEPPSEPNDPAGGGGGGGEPPAQGGSTLIQNDDGSFLEIGEDGVPLGRWTWDPEEEAWIFEPITPLANLPQTGDVLGQPDLGGFIALWALLLAAMAAALLRRRLDGQG